MPRTELIIFDCDGVLVDTETITARVLSSALAEHGIRTSPADCEDRHAGASLAQTKTGYEAQGHTLPDDFVITIRARILETLSRGVNPMPGVHDLLAQLTVPFCVASSGKPEKTRQSLRLAKLLDQFEPHIFSAFTVGFYKPEPHLFLHAAQTMGADPAHTLVIEDSPVGVQAGVAAGMTVVGYAHTLSRAETLRGLGAHHVVDDLGDVVQILSGS